MHIVTPSSGPISSRIKLLYGVGGMVDSVKTAALGLYVLFFYATVLGLPGRLVGAAAALGLIWDATIDPVIGRLSDRTRGRFGRRHGWMLCGAAAMTVSFVLLFSPPSQLSNSGLFVWLLLTSLLLRTSHSAFVVPYLALGAEIDSDYDGRTAVAGYRAAAGQVGALIASGLALTLFFPNESGDASRFAASSYWRMAITLGALVGLAGVTAAAATWSQRRSMAPSLDAPPIRLGWRELRRNRRFVWLTASVALFFLAIVINTTLAVYYLTYFARIESGSSLALLQAVLHLGAIAGVAGWALLGRRADKRTLYCVASVGLGLLVISGFWAARADGPFHDVLLPVLSVAYLMAGVFTSGLAIMAPSMLADVTEEHHLRTGEHAAGVFFGASSCVNQVAAGLATVIGGVLIDAYAGLAPGAASQSALTITRIGVLACIMPGVLMVVAGLMILRYQGHRPAPPSTARPLTETIGAA